MDARWARRMWRAAEPYHGMIYFTPHATHAYERIGLPPAAHYFASRAAPMGAVPAEVVIATFYNFSPALVRRAIPSAWEVATPEQVTAARLEAADAALRAYLGDRVGSADLERAAELARVAAGALGPEGRPLYAGHARLRWPDEPHLALWHAITLLREHRGDGHVAALTLEGLDGCEALWTHGAAGDVPLEVLQRTRGWSDAEWEAARQRLVDRGILEGSRLTDRGRRLRERVEQATDQAAMAGWRALGPEGCAELRELIRPLSRAIVDAGVFGGRR